MKTSKGMYRGMGTPAMIAVIAIAFVVAGATYFNLRPEGEIMMEKGKEMMEEGEKMMEEGEAMKKDGEAMMEEGEAMMEKKEDGAAMEEKGDGVMEEKDGVDGAMEQKDSDSGSQPVSSAVEYQGQVLASGSGGAVLLDFNKADYDAAMENGALIAMFFYANWCPTCRVEFPRMEQAFEELDGNVVGFRVNYNDSQTDNDERQLARDNGVGYQHTKVFIKDGERILKSPEGWSKNRYISEINNAL